MNRQPLGYLGPGTAPRRGLSVQQQQQGKAAKGATASGGAAAVGGAQLSSPVAISRLRRGGGCDSYGGGGGMPAQRLQLQQLHGAVHHQQRMGIMPKDGKFFRPLPRTRRGSWGGENKIQQYGTFPSFPIYFHRARECVAETEMQQNITIHLTATMARQP